ncbi:unnamed protein product [Miscanthus lutarioriparius]|uniref:Uncharacterized protein n=1 Tax=Miscanthus lutarioriparius TaxID=422564 RepID=A0A811MXN3_9POAL|nr:unnamed protein product [Miscanthus lutarioriparius]
MKPFMCFGGAAAAAAVIDDEAAEVASRHLQGQRRGRQSLSFRRKFLPGYKGGNEKKPSAAQPLAESKKRGMDADADVVYGVSRASSVASSALLSSASSLDSDTSSASSASSRSSTALSSPSVSGVLYPPPVKRQADSNKMPASSSPAAGAAAVVLCLLMVVFCGRVGATLLTSTALYLFPRRWPARTTRKEKRGAVDSLECDAAASASEDEEVETAKRKVVMEGSLVGNRNK